MKKTVILICSLVMLIVFSGCMGPAKVEKFNSIKANETAFLVPLEGASKSGQGKFMSVDYLNQNKVATKRISIPLRKRETGRLWFDYEWIPTVAVIKVNRAPVTSEWTGGTDTGTSSSDQAIWVESKDSIGFGVGVNVTAMVKEEDAALFLYNYAGTPLNRVVDTNVRGKVNSILSREFAKYNLEEGRKKKNEIFEIASEETLEHFSKMGVTISILGLTEGLVYEDKEIQQAINNKFMAEMTIQIEEQKNQAQEKINSRNIGIAKAEKLAAIEFEKAAESRKKQVQVDIDKMIAEARLITAQRWDGSLPMNILPSDSPLLYNLQGTE